MVLKAPGTSSLTKSTTLSRAVAGGFLRRALTWSRTHRRSVGLTTTKTEWCTAIKIEPTATTQPSLATAMPVSLPRTAAAGTLSSRSDPVRPPIKGMRSVTCVWR